MALARAHGAHPRDAAKLTEAGFVRLNGARMTAPGHAVRVGDVVTLALDRRCGWSRWPGFANGEGGERRPRALQRHDRPRRLIRALSALILAASAAIGRGVALLAAYLLLR